MNHDEWDRRIATGRERLETENRREADMINRMQNHCCLGLIALYTFGVFFAFVVSRVQEYPEVQATMVKLPVASDNGFGGEDLPALIKHDRAFRDRSLPDPLEPPVLSPDETPLPGETGPIVKKDILSHGARPADQLSIKTRARPNSFDTQALPPPSVESQDNTLDPERQYADALNVQLLNAGSNLQDLVATAQEALSHPASMKNPEWRNQAANAMINVQDAATNMAAMYPIPEAFRKVDARAKQTGDACLALNHQFAAAVDSLQPAKVREFLKHIGPVKAQLSALGHDLDAIAPTSHP